MGNCVATHDAIVQQTGANDKQSSREIITREVTKEKKIVRLRLDQEEELESNGKAVRIKVVMTQRELIEILRHKSKYSSIEQLLGSMKVKNRRVVVHSRVKNNRDTTRGWRPALESITE